MRFKNKISTLGNENPAIISKVEFIREETDFKRITSLIAKGWAVLKVLNIDSSPLHVLGELYDK